MTVLAPISFCLGNVAHVFQANVDLRFRNLSIHNPPFRRMLVWTFHNISASWILLHLGEVSIWSPYIVLYTYNYVHIYIYIYIYIYIHIWNWLQHMLFMTRAFPRAIQAAWVPPAAPPASSGPEFVLRAFEVSLEDMFWDAVWRIRCDGVKCYTGIHWITKLKSSKEVNASAQKKKPWMREIMRCSLSFPGYADLWCIVQSCFLWGSYVWTNGYVWGRWRANSSISEMEDA